MNILDYNLPEEKIAFKPKDQRENSKLLTYINGSVRDHIFSDIVSLLDSQYDLVLNETKVVNARIYFKKDTGAQLEIFCLEPSEGDITEQLTRKDGVHWNCFVGGAKKWKEGRLTSIAHHNEREIKLYAEKQSVNEGVFQLYLTWSDAALSFSEILEIFGKVPLPPYIKRNAESEDKLRYQTVFAAKEGSVAAPTASLHFTEDILTALHERGINQAKVSLHVGAGTFKPISSSISDHEMHHELFEISYEQLIALAELPHIIAVGTTAVRTIESLFILATTLKTGGVGDLSMPQQVSQWEWRNQERQFMDHKEAFLFLADELKRTGLEHLNGYTSLMIVPGFRFNVIKGLITNFHMPKSTLLLLVAALVGEDWRNIYEHALNNQYRFLSYGDSSLLIP